MWKIANTAAHEAADRETDARNEVGRLTQLLVDYRPLAVSTPELQPEQVALLEESCSVVSIVETRVLVYFGEKRGALFYTKDMLLAVGDRLEAQIAADRAEDAKFR